MRFEPNEVLGEFSQLINRQWRIAAMNHSMAIRANRDEIFNWIHHIVFTYFTEWHQMVDVDKAATEFTVLFSELEFANGARCTVVPDAFVSSATIPLVPIHKHLGSLSFRVPGARHILIREDRGFFDLL